MVIPFICSKYLVMTKIIGKSGSPFCDVIKYDKPVKTPCSVIPTQARMTEQAEYQTFYDTVK
ncbi:MAG: hypothetical protein BA862_00180 [Desulfobulbaceae bacterium S3730MH12]|nr:MAG: hypothetical protein BA866_07755 [Desulfobulbaceae bacterium S5133MH15]OEU54754.1 MAG: hypothetical protein BA862_00180 [Desulfobulbaceae bacterium S3730MH12]OEU84118.1 MAG: hypothetical protein BA873_05745 [Desulfobulbaceae bacterium C00003063]